MGNDSADDHRIDADPSEFEEWLDQQAVAEGISKDELFQQLISSYWTVNEMSELLGETDKGESTAEPGVGDDSGSTRTDTSEADLVTEVEELRERVAVLEDELATESEHSTRVVGTVKVLIDRVDELESQLSEVESVSDARTTELSEELDSVESSLTEEQAALRSRLDSEFSDLRVILEHLLAATDGLDDRIDELRRKHRSEIGSIRTAVEELQTERALFEQITEDAAEIGTNTARCADCSRSIDLGLLSRPYCPGCETRLVGVKEGTKWGFLSDPIAETDSADGPQYATTTPEADPSPDGGSTGSEAEHRDEGKGGDRETPSPDLTVDDIPSESADDDGDGDTFGDLEDLLNDDTDDESSPEP